MLKNLKIMINDYLLNYLMNQLQKDNRMYELTKMNEIEIKKIGYGNKYRLTLEIPYR